MKNDKTELSRSTGKFKNADELLTAYNALESEFTKRCQLLKQLQAELDGLRAQAENMRSENTVRSDAPSDCTSGAEPLDVATAETATVARTTDDEPAELVVPADIMRHADEYAEVLSAIPEVMNACIARYKKKLLDARIGFASPTGAAVIAPAARPKTLSDAKRLADDLLNL